MFIESFNTSFIVFHFLLEMTAYIRPSNILYKYNIYTFTNVGFTFIFFK